jgi:molybdopterin-biosynthesis enzyme MoeA-like protein
LWEAREGLAGAERVVVEAEKQAQVPAGAAPISDVTIRACTSYMQLDEVWDTLSERDKLRVRQAGQPRDMMSDEQFRAMVREVLGRRGATA